ncbi:GNAT family N-acetyltransferase [Bacillus sp. JJ1533]|uniref:GNAT family N-acetyltransferase n=1 Tax=Bacillus sp. JJ1533 TaxID=3122959 RepID=UPI0030006B56
MEYRLLQEDEFGQAIELADGVFREEGHVSMGEAFPHVFSPAFNQSYGAFEDKTLVAFIGLVPSVICSENAEIQAYSIGAVCTHPDYRKRGIGTHLLKQVFAHIQKAGASILFVSGDLPIYKKAGCTYYGEVYRYDLHPGSLESNRKYTVRELLPYDWFHIRKLSHNRPVRYEQSLFELALLRQSAGFASIFKAKQNVLVAEEDGVEKGFLVMTTPTQEENQAFSRVIEWGGEPKAITSLLAESFRFGMDTLRVKVPWFETKLIESLDSLNKIKTAYPGTIKIMDLDILLEQLAPYFEGKITISSTDANQKQLTWKQHSITVENQMLEQMILTGEHGLDYDFSGIFPVPLPYPEGLNYV